MSGWPNDQQRQAIEFLREENRVLQEQLGAKRILHNDDQRRRLATKGKSLGHRLLGEIVWWILGMGPHCEVIKPEALGERVRESAQRTAGLYG